MREAQERNLQANAQREAVQARRLWADRLRAAGVPEGFFDSTFDTYTPVSEPASKMLRVVQAYAQNFSHVLKSRPVSGMVFVGVPGTGKTHVACAMLSTVLAANHSAAYLSCPQFLLSAREAQFARSGEERASVLLDRYIRPQFLVLDEFGTHTTQDVDYQMLFSLVDGRYQLNLPTLLVTNLHRADLEATVDTRFLERVKGVQGPILAFDWPTHRRPNAHVRA